MLYHFLLKFLGTIFVGTGFAGTAFVASMNSSHVITESLAILPKCLPSSQVLLLVLGLNIFELHNILVQVRFTTSILELNI